MSTLSAVNRPHTLSELAMAFDTTTSRLEGILRRYHIGPAVRIGRVRLFGPNEARAIYSLLHAA
jgi:hypothetical protein